MDEKEKTTAAPAEPEDAVTPETSEKKAGEDNHLTTGLCIGLALGVSLGLLFDNLALGIGIGMCLGVAIGSSIKK